MYRFQSGSVFFARIEKGVRVSRACKDRLALCWIGKANLNGFSNAFEHYFHMGAGIEYELNYVLCIRS